MSNSTKSTNTVKTAIDNNGRSWSYRDLTVNTMPELSRVENFLINTYEMLKRNGFEWRVMFMMVCVSVLFTTFLYAMYR